MDDDVDVCCIMIEFVDIFVVVSRYLYVDTAASLCRLKFRLPVGGKL